MILCTSWLQSPGKVYCRAVNIWVTRVELRPYSFCPSRTPALHFLYKRAIRQKFSTPGISELSVQNIRDSGEILSKDLWEEKNYCERRNELSSWRPVALPNRLIHLCLFNLGYDVHALLSSVMYILSGENITAMYTMSRLLRHHNSWLVANRLNRAGDTYDLLLHVSPWVEVTVNSKEKNSSVFCPNYVREFGLRFCSIS